MKRALIALAVTIYAASAQAAAVSCTKLTGTVRGISCTCATGTCDPSSGTPTVPGSVGTTTASVKVDLNVTSLTVKMCPTAAGATINASKVDLYFYIGGGWAAFGSPYAGGASRSPDGCVLMPFDSPGLGFPIIAKWSGMLPTWAQVIPSGTTTSAGGVLVEVTPSGPAGVL